MTIPIPSLSTNIFARSILESFAGTKTETEKTALWQKFLKSRGITTLPFNNPPAIVSLNKDFLGYVQNELEKEIGIATFSPQEIARRKLVFTIYDILLLLLEKIQKTAGAESELLVFMTKMQEEYSKGMARVPLYKDKGPLSRDIAIGLPGDSTAGVGENATIVYGDYDSNGVFQSALFNVDKSKLGYGDITFREIAEALAFGETTSFALTGPTFLVDNDTVGFSIVFRSDGVSLNIYNYTLPMGQQLALQVRSIPVTPGSSVDAYIDAIRAIYNIGAPFIDGSGRFQLSGSFTIPTWNPSFNTPTPVPDMVAFTGPFGYAFNIPFRFSGTANTDFQTRAAANNVLQQYIEALRARRESWKDRAETIQGNFDVSMQAIKGQTGILTSAIQQLRNILNSIFRS